MPGGLNKNGVPCGHSVKRIGTEENKKLAVVDIQCHHISQSFLRSIFT